LSHIRHCNKVFSGSPSFHLLNNFREWGIIISPIEKQTGKEGGEIIGPSFQFSEVGEIRFQLSACQQN
jgi:hypothetical protein